jgi:hypothetical protein
MILSEVEMFHRGFGVEFESRTFPTVSYLASMILFEVEMFHWGFGIQVLRLKVEVEARPYVSYLASMIIVIETKHGTINGCLGVGPTDTLNQLGRSYSNGIGH